MAEIVLEDLSKVFANGTEAVDEVSLRVPDGKLIVLVGPSGCGKTTVLRMVAGLEDATGGRIIIGDRIVNEVPPGDRDIAMVFQNYALYPHMTVYQNMALSLKIHKLKKDEIRKRVREAARVLHLEDLLDRRPRELSGGERQQVAMRRANVREPQAFLMDEPLSNLDAKLRVQMRSEILRIQRELQVTTVYVTHDQTEAMTLGDLVAVMKKGVLQQVASSEEVYERTAKLFVVGFIGSRVLTLVYCTLPRDDEVTTGDVTHDQTEAITLGDLVAVMKKGVLQQVASPEEVYERPANLFVGGFIGSPAMNLVDATLSRDGDRMIAAFGGHRLVVPPAVVADRPGL